LNAENVAGTLKRTPRDGKFSNSFPFCLSFASKLGAKSITSRSARSIWKLDRRTIHPSMNKLLFACLWVVSGAVVQAQTIDPTRLPGRTNFDSGAPHDCLPAAMRVYQVLPGPPTCTWKRLLSARYSDGRLNHVYCVFCLGSQFYAYDNEWGSRRVFPSDKSVTAVVQAVDFQATYGVYLDQESKPKPLVAAATSQTSKPQRSAKKTKAKTPARAAGEERKE
jgi:hypothetical protein